jgi:hypothetical protein
MPGTMKKRPALGGASGCPSYGRSRPPLGRKAVEINTRALWRNGQAMQAKQYLCRRKTKRLHTMWGQLSLV